MPWTTKEGHAVKIAGEVNPREGGRRVFPPPALAPIWLRICVSMICYAYHMSWMLCSCDIYQDLLWAKMYINTFHVFISFCLFWNALSYSHTLLACFKILIIASLMGFSRIFMSMHFPSDLVAGAYLGSITPIILYNHLYREKVENIKKLRRV